MNQAQDTSFDLFAPTATDGYKVGHRPLYPNGTNFTYSNGTPRSDRLFKQNKSRSVHWDGKVVWFGMQGVMREIHGLWQRSFFSKPKDAVVRRYARRMNQYLGNGAVDTQCFADLHDLGYLPITVLSIPEGERLNMNVPGYVVYNTHPEFFWVVNYLETIMSALMWKMVTNATIAYEYRRVMNHYAGFTGVDKSYVDIQGHDFSFRGMSGPEDAARCGTAHLLCFKGTDTLPAIDYAEDMYFADGDKEFLACSVVATEHAVATSNILFNASKILAKLKQERGENIGVESSYLLSGGELEFLREAITVKHASGIISLVSDSFDFWQVLEYASASLKNEILARTPDANGFAKVVFRPDSGDPVEVLCGKELFTSEEAQDFWQNCLNPYRSPVSQEVSELPAKDCSDSDKLSQKELLLTHNGEVFRAYRQDLVRDKPEGTTEEIIGYWMVPVSAAPLTAQEKGAVQVLWDIFGGTTTDKGFQVLHERVGLIYGDSITVERCEEILRRLAKKNFASCNTVFGLGSYTYQHNSRDVFGIAVKATAVRVGDEIVELFKAPKTEGDTLKKSAKGFLRVLKDDAGNFQLEQECVMTIAELETNSGWLKPIYKNGVFTNSTTLGDIRSTLAQ